MIPMKRTTPLHRWRVLLTVCALALILAAAAGAAEPEPSADPDLRFRNVVVHPETPTVVEMSSTDVNRVTCSEPIQDVVYSAEKGVSVRFLDREAFVKFLVRKKGTETLHATEPTELYVVCGGAVYTLIAQPRRVPPPPIRLAAPKGDAVRENREHLAGLPRELKLVTLIREAYTGELPESYLVRPVNRTVDLSAGLTVVVRRLVLVEGEGLQVKELHVTAGSDGGERHLAEHLFADPALGPERKAAVAIEKTNLQPGETTRVFVVELAQGG
ncbi:MAG: type-F conjugative transfer system secretin TraK [Deferrisomatales bacterium]|nr:type-F conjugative transfer system secretin TraK [Deferrisomatales bacterium]